jgi:hypothetical protein
LTVQLAEAFGVKTVRKTLRQLVDELVDVNIDGAQAKTEERWDLARRAEEIDAEITRRLSLVDGFHGTEATRMRAILDTGEDKPWWQK